MRFMKSQVTDGQLSVSQYNDSLNSAVKELSKLIDLEQTQETVESDSSLASSDLTVQNQPPFAVNLYEYIILMKEEVDTTSPLFSPESNDITPPEIAKGRSLSISISATDLRRSGSQEDEDSLASLSFWQTAYSKKKEPYNWYLPYTSLKPYFEEVLKPEDRILEVGCGNSTISEELFLDGYGRKEGARLVATDFSSVAIEKMTERRDNHLNKLLAERGDAIDTSGLVRLEYYVMDAMAMVFNEGSFDVIFDKGTMDAIMCGKGADSKIAKMFHEVYRVLSKGGRYILISCNPPSSTFKFFTRKTFNWDVHYKALRSNGKFICYFYVGKKL